MSILLKHISTGYVQDKRQKIVLPDFSLSLQVGEVVGILGPNGAGKSTLLRALTGLAPIFSGEYIIGGKPWSRSALAQIGMVLESPGVYRGFQYKEYLDYFHSLYIDNKLYDQSEINRQWNLRDDQTPIHKYSSGKMQWLHVVRSLIHNPDFVFWDEIWNHLDPLRVEELQEQIATRTTHPTNRLQGFLLTGHHIDQIAKLCHRILVLKEGRLIWQGNREDLDKELRLPRLWVKTEVEPNDEQIHAIENESRGQICYRKAKLGQDAFAWEAGGGFESNAPISLDDVHPLFVRQHLQISHFMPLRRSLNDWYRDVLTRDAIQYDATTLSANPHLEKPATTVEFLPKPLAAHQLISVMIKKEFKLVKREKQFIVPFVVLPLIIIAMYGWGLLTGSASFSTAQVTIFALSLIPVLSSSGLVLAADSFAGEKERKTIETLMSTPVPHHVLFWGKLLGLLPAPLLVCVLGESMYLSLGYYAGFVWHVDELARLFLLILCSPLLILSAALYISTRVDTVRAASQISALFLLGLIISMPLLGLFYWDAGYAWMLPVVGSLLATGFFTWLSHRRFIAIFHGSRAKPSGQK